LARGVDHSEVIGSLPDAVIVLDREKRILAWLGAAPSLLGWSEEEVLGANLDEQLRPRDENGNSCCIGPAEPRRVLSIVKGTPEQEVLVSTERGSDRWVGVTCAYERGADRQIKRILVVARDIRRRKGVDLEKSEVISAVSHELRSPLTSIKGFTATLLHKWERFSDEAKKHMLLTVQTDADRLARLIGELLDMSRIEAGRLQLRRQMVDVAEVARRVMERIQPAAGGHTLCTKFPPQPPLVWGDPEKIEQVLSNLVENAIKHTEGGTITVDVASDADAVRVGVSDQGSGIPAEQRRQIFGKYFRRGERTGSPSGAGLGLYISKGLVEAHGGKMWVEDAPGGGALFAFTLPTSGAEAPEAS